MYTCIYESMHLCICASMHLCIHASMHLCIYASMHLCIYASMHLCIYAPAAARRGKNDMTNIGPNIKQSRETNTNICLKNHSKLFQKSFENRPTLVQKSTKMGPKIDQNRSQGPLGGLWRPSWPQDGSKSQNDLQKSVRGPFVGPLLGSQNRPKSMKNQSKIGSKIHNFFC